MDTQVDAVRISLEGSTKRCRLRDGVIPEAARRIRGGSKGEATLGSLCTTEGSKNGMDAHHRKQQV